MKQLRAIDIVLFAIFAVVSEYLSVHFGNYFSTRFYYNPKTLLFLIILFRWGRYGVITVLLANFVTFYTSDMVGWSGFLYEVVAGSFIAIPFFIYGKRNRNLVIKGRLKFLGFVAASHLCLCVGKGLAFFIIDGVAAGFLIYLGTNLFIITFDILICFLLRTVKGLIVDMEKYDLVSDEV